MDGKIYSLDKGIKIMKKKRMCLAAVLLLSIVLSGCMADPYEDGVEALKDGQYKEAAEQFKKAADKGKSKADAYRGLGIALWETGNYEGAKDAFENVLEESGEETGTLYHFLGSCELKTDNPKKAIEYFEKGLKDEKISDEVKQEMRFNSIAAYEKLGDMDTARTLLKEYAADYPEDESAAKEAQFWETR